MHQSYKLGLRGKTSLALAGLLFVALAVTSFASYWQSRVIAEQKVMELEQSKLSVFKRDITVELTGHHNNLLSLHDVPPIAAILRAKAHNGVDPVSGDTLHEWRGRLSTIFKALLDNHPQYFQIRFIDAAGNELVKVEKGTGNISLVADDTQLQNKFDSEYVSQTLKLKPGQTYFSHVSLNREHGVIQVPHVPVLRMARPVYDANNQIVAMIVLNLSTNKLFSEIKSTADGVERNIVDESGYYIKHTDSAKTFGLERDVKFRFQDVEPELAKMATNYDHYIRRHAQHKELDGFQKVYYSPLDHSQYWLLTMHVPEHVVFADTTLALNKLLMVSFIIGFFSLLLIIWFVSRKILTPVVKLAVAAKELQDGDLTVRLDTTAAHGEFLTLYTAINAFAQNQQQATAQLQNEVAAQTKTLSAVIDNIVDGIISIGERGTIESFNPAARRIFGYSDGEVIGQNVKMLMPEPYHSEHDDYLDHHITTGEKKVIGIGREVIGRRKDGSTFPMELAVSAVVIDNIRHFVGITRDITERKAFEQRLMDEKKQLSAVIDNVVDGIITIGERGTIESFNPAARRIFGYNDAEVIGQNVKMLMPEPYHSEHDGYLDYHITTGEKKVIGIGREVTGRRKDGSTFPMELAVSAVVIDNVRHFVGITRDITERKHNEQMQREFISTVSHELRTPLTSIRGSLGLVLGGVVGELPEKAKALLTIANNNSERLIHLINDILDMEKIAAGKMQFDYRVVNLTTVIQNAVESNKGYGDQLDVTFELVTVPEDEVTVRIDEKRMAQVMSNLLSNAAKYSPTHDRVEISIEASEKTVRISVHDHGKGIPEAFKSRVFSKFAQADSSDTRQKGGTGLGLNITKAIVEQQAGTIAFQSGECKGTTFYVDLPIWQEAVKKVKKSSKVVDVEKPLVLIVEDDPDISKLISMFVENDGYQFHQAFSCKEAKERLRKDHYSVVTLDLNLPDGNGISLMQDIHNSDPDRETPVVIVSANIQGQLLQPEQHTTSVLDWIQKPIDEKRLLQTIHVAAAAKPGQRLTILHVEDDEDIASIVDTMLQGEFTITHANTLQKGRALLATQPFDLLLLDIGLPDGSGLDLLPLVDELNQPMPVLIFSAQDVDPSVIGNVSGVLIKSKMDNERLMQQIKSAINNGVS